VHVWEVNEFRGVPAQYVKRDTKMSNVVRARRARRFRRHRKLRQRERRARRRRVYRERLMENIRRRLRMVGPYDGTIRYRKNETLAVNRPAVIDRAVCV